MASNEYHLVTHWQVPGRREDFYALLAEVAGDAASLLSYWPEATLEVDVVDPGSPGGLGLVLDVRTRGFLPHRLNWRVDVVHVEDLCVYQFRASGDFVGTGTWRIRAESDRNSSRVRLEDPRREAGRSSFVALVTASLRGQPSLGDGQGRASSAKRARSKSGCQVERTRRTQAAHSRSRLCWAQRWLSARKPGSLRNDAKSGSSASSVLRQPPSSSSSRKRAMAMVRSCDLFTSSLASPCSEREKAGR